MSTYKSWLEKTKSQINKTYDAQKELTENSYNQAINRAGTNYESAYRENEVDRIFNEKKIAEINANLGLTNSGLNRTQQTAVQLSHANRNYEISKARRKAIEDLDLEKTGKLTEIENSRQSALYDADMSYEEKVAAEEAAKAQAQAAQAAAAAKAAEEAANQKYVYWHRAGQDENGYYVYLDTATGKTKALPKGINPYTGTPTANPGEFDTWNGYQPKGVVFNGTEYGNKKENTFKANSLGIEKQDYQGHKKTVWETKKYVTVDGTTTNLWIWDDYDDCYWPVEYNPRTGKIDVIKVE